MWIKANPNPCRQEEPDCVVRAIAIATEQTWKKVHKDLCGLAYEKCTMPSVNWLWNLYLIRRGFERHTLPDTCPVCMTVADFSKRFPYGTYIVCTGSHAVAVMDGDWYDLWDSGDEMVTYYYRKRGKEYG